jgi:hypothetical protein
MRYYRGTQNIKRAGPALFNKVKTEGGSVYDLWLECGEDWTSVQVLHEKYEDHKTTQFSIDDYKTRAQLIDTYKSEPIVDAIIADKRARGGHWVMRHPECPTLEDATLFLCWGGAGTRKEDVLGSTTKLRGAHDMDGSDKDTARVLSALLEGNKAVASLDSGLQCESAASVQESAEAAAVAKLAAGREEEVKAAALAREEKRREAAAQRTPSDIARGGIVKLSNVVAAKMRLLQAAAVEVLHLPKNAPEEASAYELYKAQQSGLHIECTKLKAELDSALALGSRATEKFLQDTCASTSTRLCGAINTPTPPHTAEATISLVVDFEGSIFQKSHVYMALTPCFRGKSTSTCKYQITLQSFML